MFIAILTLLSALSISGVAIFYSVIGLATIFPGAFWPVVIMGSVLEVGKLITASWLYRQWKFTPFLLKTYLTTAVVLLSIITSMGIFGFLSKAHLEQNLASDTLVQRVDIINDKIESQTVYIERQKAVILRSEKAIDRAGKDFTQDITVQENIINSAYARLEVLDADVKAYTDQGKGFFKGDNIKRGVELRTQQKPERDKLNAEIEEAKELIQKYRDQSRQGGDSNNLIIEQAENNIIEAQNKIDDLIIDRQPLEKKLINLEAEVGPVKYIAALAVDWGMTEEVNLSKAVRWVILLIIVVFDPLAVLLLIAANQSFARRFPPTAPKPQEIIDLEKPDDEGIILELNQATANKKKVNKIEKQIKDWQDKLKKFNEKAPKPSNKPVEFITQKLNEELKKQEFDKRMKEDEAKLDEVSRKAKEEQQQIPEFDEERMDIVSQNGNDGLHYNEEPENSKVGFDINDHIYDMDPVINPDWAEDENNSWNKRKAQEDKIKKATLEEALKLSNAESVETVIEPTISEQIEDVMSKGRIKPDLTEVIEPANKFGQSNTVDKAKKTKKGVLGSVLIKDGRGVESVPAKPTKEVEIKDGKKNIVPKKDYVQNEEQIESGNWSKIKSSNKQINDEDYHQRIESRVNDLITKINSGEATLEQLPEEDQKLVKDFIDDDRE